MVEIGGAVASRQGLNIPGETAALPSVPDEDLEHVQTGERIGVDLVALSFVRRARGHRDRARAHAAAADRQDREAAGGPARGGDRARRGLRDGRARRPRDRAAHRGGADRPEAGDRARRRARPAVDHRDADARLDGRLLAPDPRRGGRRRQRDPRRHGRGDALPGERGRPVPRRRGVDDGGDRRADGADRPVPRVERAPGAARPARSRLHARLHRLPRGARARPRRARVPDAVRPLRAADLGPPPDRARSTRSPPAARPSAAAG